MIAKLNAGVISFAPDKITFTNPPEQMLKDYAGYQEYTEQEKPEYDPQTQRLAANYTQTESGILCTWTVEDVEQEQADTPQRR